MQPPVEGQEQVAAKQPAKTRMVKIRAVRDIRLASGDVLKPGQTAVVPSEEAELLCDHPKVKGHYAFSGERPTSEVERHVMVRAERLG